MPTLPEISPDHQTLVPSERQCVHEIEDHAWPCPESDFRVHEDLIAEAFERELHAVGIPPTSARPSELASSCQFASEVASPRTKIAHEWSCDNIDEERRGISSRFSAHVHSVAVLVIGHGRSWGQLAGFATVGIVSVACISTLLRWLAVFNGIGLFKVCTAESFRTQEVLTCRLIWAITTVVLGSLIVVWLLVRASTSDTRQVAVVLVSLSLSSDISAWVRIDECFGEKSKYLSLLYVTLPIALLATFMQYAHICLTRLATLQRSAMIGNNSKAMRLVGWIVPLLSSAAYLSLEQFVSVHGESVVGKIFFSYGVLCGLLFLAWFSWIVHSYYVVLPTLLQGVGLASGLDKQELVRALKTHIFQLVGVTMTLSTTWLVGMCQLIRYIFDLDTYTRSVWFQWIEACVFEFFYPALYFSVLLFSGAFFGALSGGRKRRQQEIIRECRWNGASRKWRKTNRVLNAPGGTFMKTMRLSASNRRSSQHSATILPTLPSADWRTKVIDLANRGVSLAAMLRFYREDLREAMPDYTSSKHTTRDVVRRAIIPLSRMACSSYASVMMHGQLVKPKKMVTHNWGNLFRDLLAAVLCDALEEHEYGKVAQLLDYDVETIERWIKHKGISDDTYWICAFSVSQHDGICSLNLLDERDTLTGEPYPICDCGKSKFFNTTPPLYKGKSIRCEMNKFDDMIAYLSANDSQFSQVIAVDAKFELFSRAWCVAELAMANAMGMKQSMLVVSAEGLDAHSGTLRDLRVQDMQASRPEDVQEILATIQDKDRFNTDLQTLIFESLLVDWRNLDATAQMVLVGRVVRWQAVALVVEGRHQKSHWLPEVKK